MHQECTRDVPEVFPIYSRSIPAIFSKSAGDFPDMFLKCSMDVPELFREHCKKSETTLWHTTKSSGSQNIIIETGRHPDQLNTRHTINVVVNNSKRERQKQYRERNREKLSQREAEKRRRLQNAESIIELHTSPNIGNREIITEPIIIIDEVSTNSRNLTGLGEMEHEVFDISQQNLSNLSSANITAIPNNYSQFRYHTTDFMNSRNKLTIYTLNCQSLRKYAADLQDSICRNSNFLLLTETWCPADEAVDLCNFHCIAKFKRQNVRAAGVAIYKNNNTSHVTTLNMDLAVQNSTEVHVSQTSIGEMCASHVKLENGTGDFNVNFARAESMPLMTFLQKEFQLQINNNPRESTTKYGTTIDAVFVRYLDDVSSNTFVTYFSYHRPIVIVISAEETSNITITEVTDENI
ncbi:uncharacterized protein LOC141538285 [Cotesia typhae]|uniref:uncharacterized protein LOC141538285 n=1 Tax=Cotesia typhae TaxID=2053667 RepID=UPI003D68A844